jgi:hypothetical protein
MKAGFRTRLIIAGIAALAAVCPLRASATDVPVDLELVLAVDTSASMMPDEQRLQRLGYVEAFRSPQVLDAIRSGPHGRIAVAYVEWADEHVQKLAVPWTLIDSASSALSFATVLADAPLSREFGTSISAALRFSGDQFEGNGFAGEREAIDLSGDGPNDLGGPVEAARDAVVARGITINGLPIMIRMRWGGGLYGIEGLDSYFEDCVIGGPGAFVVPVKKARGFAEAIKRKLVLEISGSPGVKVMTVAEMRRPERMDCLSGENAGGRLRPAR